jgi:esterase/lipase
MNNETEYAINESGYKLFVNSFEKIRNRLGLNLKVHNADNLLEDGQIFLFNHFARFETIIPPFIIHRATGAFSRSIADYSLFEASERFDKLLRGVGAVPNNLPGLLPFLGAEILRGRKVVIFPEGGMVKDRRVIDSDGGFGISFHTADERRKHHRGAAVLALTLDILKRRILGLFQKGDVARIGRWVKSLGLESMDALHAEAVKATLIVPANITFYPIRISDNVLSRGAELLLKGLPDQLLEELVIEGNLLFRATDMDIRMGEAVPVRKKWHWLERMLLERYFKGVVSLDDLFGLREGTAAHWSEKMLARCISRETYRIRDVCMESIYRNVTVNLSHLASTMIIKLVKKGEMSIKRDLFDKTLYLALKSLQQTSAIGLHRSLCWPDRYRGVADGENPLLDRFFATCRAAGLVGRTPESYRFLDKLRAESDFDEIRLENPVLVYANEVAPLAAVAGAVDAAMAKTPTVGDREIAGLLFDDEIRAHDWNRQHFNKERFREINDKETATGNAAPYLLLAEDGRGARTRTGVLLVHGLLASPAELGQYGRRLHASGLSVMGVRLAGHGTSPWDLKKRTWKDWLRSVRRGYRILSAYVERIVMVGFSAGGALSLLAAAERPEKLSGVAAVSTPVIYRNKKLAFVSLVHGINKLSSWIPSFEGIMPFIENDSEHPHINYFNIPTQGLYQLRLMTDELQNRLVEVEAPTLIIQGDGDLVVDPKSAKIIHEKLASADKTLHWVVSKRHGIINEDIGNTQKVLNAFIRRFVEDEPAGTAT